jgi:hypothetical protein
MKISVLVFFFVAIGLAANVTFAPAAENSEHPEWTTSFRGKELESQYLHQLIADAKARGTAPDPAWIARLNELESLRAKPATFESLQTPPPSENPLDQGNDNCPATVIPALPYSDTGTTVGRADNFSFCGATPAPDVVYQFAAPVTGNYTVSLCGSSFDTRLALNTGGACPGNTQIYCADNECGLQSTLTTLLTGGLTYYIIVDGSPGSLGNYVLNVSRAASCDTCEADSCPATIIPSLPYADAGTTTGRVDNWTSNCTGTVSPDVIYVLMVPSAMPIVAALTGTTFDATLDVLTGGNCPGSTYVVCDRGTNVSNAALTFQAAPNTPYYIIVDNVLNGNYVLHVSQACPVPCQPGDVLECADVPGPNHQSQDCNGGCWNTFWGGNAIFQPLSCGQTFCGHMFTYQGTQILSDYDWFSFSLAESCSVRVTVDAQFQWSALVEAAGCPVEYLGFGYGPPCTPVTWMVRNVNADIFPPGNYLLEFQYGAINPNNVIPVPLDYRLSLECAPSHVPCFACNPQPGDLVECPETPDSSNFTNDCNGGCRMEPDQFQNMVCGQTVCGVGFTYVRPDGGYRDTDWYRFSLAETSRVTLQAYADFQVDVHVSHFADCPFGSLMGGSGPACTPLTFSSAGCLPAGDYLLLVEPFFNGGIPSPRPYRVTLGCNSCSCPPVDSLTIKPVGSPVTSLMLNMYVPAPGWVRFYATTSTTAVYPTGFNLVGTFHANSAGHYTSPQPANVLYARFVATLDSCGP